MNTNKEEAIHILYVPIKLERNEILAQCVVCGSLIKDDQIGKSAHSIWHYEEGLRTRKVISESGG